MKRSNGSRQDLQRHCALHGVEPKRLTSTVSVEPHCGHWAVADGVFERGRERLLSATGRAYAEKLSVADLRKLVAFYRTPAADRAQAALPLVIGETMRSVGKMDFKGEVLAAFCKETGKLCAK